MGRTQTDTVRLSPIVTLTALVIGLSSGAQSTKSASKGATPSKQAAAAKQSKGSSKAARRSASTRKSTAKTTRQRTSRRVGQQAPTRERYAEIQQALIAHGYLNSPATGVWGPESVEALRRFQQDHSLEPSGKLNALTLIALGLGPNRASHLRPPARGSEPQAPERP